MVSHARSLKKNLLQQGQEPTTNSTNRWRTVPGNQFFKNIFSPFYEFSFIDLLSFVKRFKTFLVTLYQNSV